MVNLKVFEKKSLKIGNSKIPNLFFFFFFFFFCEGHWEENSGYYDRVLVVNICY